MWVTLSWFFLSDFMESNQLLNWKLFLKQKTMSYMLFYLVCVMISPLKIWFLIKKKYIFGKRSVSVHQRVPGQKWGGEHKLATQRSWSEKVKEDSRQPRVLVCSLLMKSVALHWYNCLFSFLSFFFQYQLLQLYLGPLIGSLHLTDYRSMLTSQLLRTRSNSPKWWMKYQPWDLNCRVRFLQWLST